MAKPRLGFIGTGAMGAPIAAKLLERGHPLTVWNRSEGRASGLVEAGAEVAATPAELTRRAEIVFTCVTDTAAVDAVVFGPDGIASAARPDQVLVDHSSIKPDRTRALAGRLRAASGMGWIDAPVSGGPPGVANGTLVIMAGGSEADFACVRPVLESYAGRVTLMGPQGAGQTTKLINQVLVANAFVSVAEACRLAENAGVDAALIPHCLEGGRADSRILQEYMPRMARRDRTLMARLAIIVKDLDAVQELASATGTPMPFTQLANELHRLAVAQGLGEADNAALAELYGPDRRG